ncbi:hypothetical protein KA082_00055 [Candidatus Woesebacteria bacterium]|nr:hypothetical protein [Candidatus Woesebacteria bacterium]
MMKMTLSKFAIFITSLLVLIFTATALWQMQQYKNIANNSEQNSITLPSPTITTTPTPKIIYDFRIRNTVTEKQRNQFSNSSRIAMMRNILMGRASYAYRFDQTESDYLPFSDGEVSYSIPPSESIITNVKSEFVTDSVENAHTVRIYAVKHYDYPLLRISTSSFEDVVAYEKKQFFDNWYNKEDNKVYDVEAFGHNGIELQRYDSVKMYWDNVLIVPMNGYVYVFYAHNTTEAHDANVIQSSFQFANYP